MELKRTLERLVAPAMREHMVKVHGVLKGRDEFYTSLNDSITRCNGAERRREQLELSLGALDPDEAHAVREAFQKKQAEFTQQREGLLAQRAQLPPILVELPYSSDGPFVDLATPVQKGDIRDSDDPRVGILSGAYNHLMRHFTPHDPNVRSERSNDGFIHLYGIIPIEKREGFVSEVEGKVPTMLNNSNVSFKVYSVGDLLTKGAVREEVTAVAEGPQTAARTFHFTLGSGTYGWHEYGLLYIPSEVRAAFPPYGEDFELQTDVQGLQMLPVHITSQGEGRSGGQKGQYIVTGRKLTQWYDRQGYVPRHLDDQVVRVDILRPHDADGHNAIIKVSRPTDSVPPDQRVGGRRRGR